MNSIHDNQKTIENEKLKQENEVLKKELGIKNNLGETVKHKTPEELDEAIKKLDDGIDRPEPIGEVEDVEALKYQIQMLKDQNEKLQEDLRENEKSKAVKDDVSVQHFNDDTHASH